MAKKVMGQDGKMYKVKKPIYKRVWFWIVVLIVIFAIGGGALGGDSNDKKEAKSESSTTVSQKAVEKETDKSAPTASSEVKQEKTANADEQYQACLLYTSPSPRDGLLSRMPSSA